MEHTSDVFLAPREPDKIKTLNLDIKIDNKMKRFNPSSDLSIQDYHKIVMLIVSTVLNQIVDVEYYIKENDLEKYFIDVEDSK